MIRRKISAEKARFFHWDAIRLGIYLTIAYKLVKLKHHRAFGQIARK